MADLLAGDDKNRDLTYDDAYRSYLITRRDPSSDYRFGRTHGKRVLARARTALRRVNGLFEKYDRGYRQFEGAPHGARARTSRYSLRPVQQQLGGSQSRSNQRSRGLIRAIPRPQSGFNSSRGVSHAPAFIHRIRSRFPSAQRRQLSAYVSESIMGRAGEEIPPGTPLYARSRTEMARKAI